ncbi:predicted protein [Naegleria gruberi]|uniref:Predicted protein n=1 Tax=Naegleria gruberi TaxID=5762 RepID=D2W2S0_NAEGR|nr:uncharacterized protein NAEGRDRAFT_75691 [Naegleria gruberi]EFC36694.1 predicted protein [Naegleria gruberi]|eukprot:XP_002669438.1 predicted protein [Naegleria gruberi strain NEG-M]
MCYQPTLLLPFEIVYDFVGDNLRSWDEAIRANNLRIYELINRKNYTKEQTHELQDNYSEIQELIENFHILNSSERNELRKLLTQRCIARLQTKEWKFAKQDLIHVIKILNFEPISGTSEEVSCPSSYSYLSEYLMGLCCDGLGEFSEAVQHFRNAIKHREEVEQVLKVGKEDLEKKLIKLEEPFFLVQMEEKKSMEEKGMRKRLAKYFNWNGSSNIESKRSSFVTLEELYIRAGLSYYLETFYSDSIIYLNKAITLGEENNSELVASSYYNRGLGKYYLGDWKGAIQDFSKSISLMPVTEQRYQNLIMRASTYGIDSCR